MSDLLIGKLIQIKPGFVVVPCRVMDHGNYDCVVVHNTDPVYRCYPVGGFSISLSLDQLVGPPVLDLGRLIRDTRPPITSPAADSDPNARCPF